MSTSLAHAQRSRGIDVSSWQGSISQTNWNTVRSSGVDFAFMRSSRGGTTGTYNQSDPNNTLGGNTLSQSFTDTQYANNIARARTAGIFAGPYHFSRADIISYVDNGTTITHTGTDEANHMLNVAGGQMSLGYMRPVYDLEAGSTQRTRTDLTNFALDFINRIVAVKGYAPIVYINTSYANDEVDNRLRPYDLWLARYIDPATVNVQTVVDPPTVGAYPNVYGVWSTYTTGNPVHPTPRPWDFWQYTSTGTTPGISGNNDLNVANGDIEFVKDFLVPALWQPDADGQWTTASNWNGSSVQLLPGPNDRVTINKPGARIITLSSGAQSVRSLNLSEALRITGGSLTISQDMVIAVGGSMRIDTGSVTARTINAAGRIELYGGSLTTTSATSTLPFVSTDAVWLGGGTLTNPNGQFKTLTLSGGTLRLTSTTLWTSAESFSMTTNGGLSPRSTLDLGRATLVWNYPTTTTSIVALTSARTSLFDALSPDTDPRYAVGYANASAFITTLPAVQGGVSIDSSSILFRRTLKGDANVDGTVNFDDLLKLASAYNATSNLFWIDGDFDYNGTVDFSDLLALAANYNSSVSGDWALAQASVPEPAALASAMVGAMAVLRRRGRAVTSLA